MSFNPDNAIQVSGLSKCFEIYESPRARLKQFIYPFLQRCFGQKSKQYFQEFWALNDVSFNVKKGETVGIIGRNGSGKSTLLQIICGTLNPTHGSVETTGRVAALLELGSGFNPEFTGRENVYLNASVLGLSQQEIDSRFDQIVEFAEIGQFIDQPVKSYSSGMYVRLAFSVIAHVDADILVVDEALSVGDMYFQSKCIALIKKLIQSGVTVLFVSHDASTVKALCQKCIYLSSGKVVDAGETERVVEAYYNSGVQSTQKNIAQKSTSESQRLDNQIYDLDNDFNKKNHYQRLQNGKAQFLNVQLLNDQGEPLQSVNFNQKVTLRMVIQAHQDIDVLGLAYHIRDRNGFDLIYSDTGIENCHIRQIQKGEIIVQDWTFRATLKEGQYSIAAMMSIPEDLSIGKVEVCDFIPIALNLQMLGEAGKAIYASVYWTNQIHQKRRVQLPRLETKNE